MRTKLAHIDLAVPEPRLIATELASLLEPAVQKCAEAGRRNGPVVGWVLVPKVIFGPDGKLGSFDLYNIGNVEKLTACVGEALRSVTLVERPSKPVTGGMWFSLAGPEPEGLPRLYPDEELIRKEEDGTCEGREDPPPCPPNKSCMPPRQRRVACPALHGIPPQPELKDAEQRFDLGVSGGKSGQGGERVILFKVKKLCAAMKIDTPVDETSETREVVDVPCAAFDQAARAVQTKLLVKRPRGNDKVHHAVSKSVVFWTIPKSGSPSVTELRWSGPDPADAAFDEVVLDVGRAIGKRGRLRLGRLELD